MELNKGKLLDLKNKYGDAYYLLDSNQFRDNFLELKGSFSNIYPNFNIAYSYKTNYTPKLCKIVNELGGYAEVVSEMELELALRIGVDYSNIIWNGPIKTKSTVEKFLINGGTINIDSLEELEMIKEIVNCYPDQYFNLGIRCNFDVSDGVVSRFGFDVNSEDFRQVLEFTTKKPNVKLISLQCHFAKRQLDYWPNRAKGMIDLIDSIGIIPQRIDLGGGLFGKMPDSLKNQFTTEIPKYEDYANAIAPLFMEKFRGCDQLPELIIEPGSALVGDCMKFVGTVKSIKNIRGKYIASVLGSQKNVSMTGINPPVDVFNASDKQEIYNDLDFVGFTCIENDVLYKSYNGKLAVGDMIVINNCGSYSLVMKPAFILPNFAVLDISDGKEEVIKRAETFDDIFHTYNF